MVVVIVIVPPDPQVQYLDLGHLAVGQQVAVVTPERAHVGRRARRWWRRRCVPWAACRRCQVSRAARTVRRSARIR